MIDRPRHHRPCRRFFRDHLHVGMVAIHRFVQRAQKVDRVEILAPAVAVWNPLAAAPSVIEVQHRGDRVHAQAVDVVMAEPEKRARGEERAHFVAAVIEDRAVPVGVIALARIGMLVEVRAVETIQAVLVVRKMRRHPVENHADAVLVQHVDEVHEILRRAVTRRRREIAGRLVTPRAVERMLGDRHQLDVREAHALHVLDQRLRDAAIAEECVVGAAPPRAEMQLVDRHGRSERVVRSRACASTRRRSTRIRASTCARRSAALLPSRTRTDRPCPACCPDSRRCGTCKPRRAATFSTRASQMPEPSQRGFIASLPASQPLKSPITETERALGAHTAKEALPSSARWQPRFSKSRAWLPSLNR